MKISKPERNGLIVGVGFQKTGTSTLREALKILGYKVKDTSRRPLIPILKGKWDRVLRLLQNYDAVEDTPWFMIYRELDRLVPNSKFILTIRDEESWYNSVKKHIGDLRSANHEWIYGRGKGLPKDDRENTIAVYKRHNQEVLEYFKNRPDDLLVLDFTHGDGWEKLCRFLNREITEKPFPHSNKTLWGTNSFEGRKFKLMRKQIKNNLKIWYIDQMNLWEKH